MSLDPVLNEKKEIGRKKINSQCSLELVVRDQNKVRRKENKICGI
jgi:hypothetical protein